MQRYALVLQYEGSHFHGWAKQKLLAGNRTVQGALELAAEKLAGPQGLVSSYGAGRTDLGVHALAQVAHLDLLRRREGVAEASPVIEPDKLVLALNFHLRGRAVTVLSARKVSRRFHARFSAVERRYSYQLFHGSHTPSIFQAPYSWQLRDEIDVGLVRQAASMLVGRHDFRNFSLAREDTTRSLVALDVQETPIPALHAALRDVDAQFGRPLVIHARAPAFLFRQVRMIVGALVEVGRGRMSLDTLLGLRNCTSPPNVKALVAPANGLFFLGASYPPELLAEAGPVDLETVRAEDVAKASQHVL